MPDQQLEIRIGMDLACRTYLYDLLHSVFGGNCSAEFVAKLFGAQTREMLARETAMLSDEGLSLDAGCALSKVDRSLGDCAKEVLMCLDGYGEVQTMDAEQKPMRFSKGETLFLPAGLGRCLVVGDAELIKVRCLVRIYYVRLFSSRLWSLRSYFCT